MGLGLSTRVLATYYRPNKADFKENWVSPPQHFLGPGWNLMSVSMIYPETLTGLTLCRSYTGHHGCCEILRDVPCHVQKTLLCSSPLWPHPLWPLALTILAAPPPGWGCGSHTVVPFSNSTVTMFLCFGQLGVSLLLYSAIKRGFFDEAGEPHYRYKDQYLKGNLMLHPFSKMVAAGSPPMGSTATGSWSGFSARHEFPRGKWALV